MFRHTPRWGTVPVMFSDYSLPLGLTSMPVEVRSFVPRTL